MGRFSIVGLAVLAVSYPAFAQDDCSHFVGTTIAPITIKQAAARLSTLTPKDEFETTAQYDARIAVALQIAGGPLIVSKPLEDPKYLEYDADRGVLRIQSYALHNTSFNPSRLWGYGGPLYEKVKFSTIGESVSVAFGKDGRTTGSYVGTNAYGASTRVTKMQADEWGVYDHDLSTYQNIFVQADSKSYIGELNLTPDEGRKLKQTGKVAYTMAPKAPYFAADRIRSSEATIDDPYEVTTTAHAVFADLQCALLADASWKVLFAAAVK